MKKPGSRLLLQVTLLLTLPLLLETTAGAQEAEQSSTTTAEKQNSKSKAKNAQAERSAQAQSGSQSSENDVNKKLPGRFLNSVYGPEVIDLGSAPRFHLLYGLTFVQSYDDHIRELATARGGASGVESYVGLLGRTRKVWYMFEHALTAAHYTTQALGTRAYHSSSFGIGRELSSTRRWSWDIRGSAHYGDDLLRPTAPLRFNTIGDVSVADPSSAAIGLTPGRVLNTSIALGLEWNRSERQSLRFSFEQGYSNFFGSRSSTNASMFRTELSHSLSARTKLAVAGTVQHHSFGRFGSRSVYGGEVGLKMQPTPRTILEMSVGPAISTGAIHPQVVTFRVAGSAQLNQTSSVSLAAARQFTTTYLASNGWADDVSFGFARRLGSTKDFRLDAGYFHTDFAPLSSGTVGPYEGYFVEPQLIWRLSRNLSAEISYRHAYRLTVAGLSRNIVAFRLTWKPAPAGLFK